MGLFPSGRWPLSGNGSAVQGFVRAVRCCMEFLVKSRNYNLSENETSLCQQESSVICKASMRFHERQMTVGLYSYWTGLLLTAPAQNASANHKTYLTIGHSPAWVRGCRRATHCVTMSEQPGRRIVKGGSWRILQGNLDCSIIVWQGHLIGPGNCWWGMAWQGPSSNKAQV